MGFLGAIVPEEYGGRGLDYRTYGLIVEEVGRRQAAARAAGHVELLLVPSEEVQRDVVALATRAADAGAWVALDERAAQFSVGQERMRGFLRRELRSGLAS